MKKFCLESGYNCGFSHQRKMITFPVYPIIDGVMIQKWTLMFSNYNFLRRFAIHRDFYQHSRWYTTRDMVSERQAKVRFCHISSKCMPFFSYVPVLLFKKGLYHRNLWPKLAYYPYLAHDRSILRVYKLTLPKMQCFLWLSFLTF